MKRQTDSGVALITAILMMALISALLVGATALVISEQKSRFQDRDRTQAFEAAHSGLEKLTNDLGDLFSKTYSPTSTQISGLTTTPPSFTGVNFTAPGGAAGSGYTITQGTMEQRTLSNGTYSGLTAMVTPYKIDVTAKTLTQAEVSLERTLNTVSIPVFQFGIFSDTDLSYYPGPDFNFGGRVHTNGNLFLAKQKNGTTELILGDRVTALGEVVRYQLSNGLPISSGGYDGPVRIITQANGCKDPTATNYNTTCRPIAVTEGSVEKGPGPSPAAVLTSKKNGDAQDWSFISMDTTTPFYGGMLKNWMTGVTRLNLPLTGAGAKPIDLIARPLPGEDPLGAVFSQRFFQFAALRILLSDKAADITGLPTVKSATAPVDLSKIVKNTYGAGRPPTASTGGVASVTGFLKIEYQKADGSDWVDVTTAILNLGYVGHNLYTGSGTCTDPDPGAIIRFQRIKRTITNCTSPDTTNGDNYGPMVLYDTREGALRDVDYMNGANPTQLHWEGVMNYVELDIANLRKWLFTNQSTVMSTTGFVLYFSDRRGSVRDASDHDSGELQFEDTVNPADSAGNPNHLKDQGEDVNGDGNLNELGAKPNSGAAILITDNVTTANAEYTATPFFRRALKLVHGNRKNMLAGWTAGANNNGLTVASENPVYIQGDYNADSSEDDTAATPFNKNETYDQPHVATAVIGDAVTLLSNEWTDAESLDKPYNDNAGPTIQRTVTKETTFRTAIISGKSMSFDKPTWSGASNDFGTDGGTHNFLRFLENWNSNPLWYRGSMVSFYYSVQATGTFKCCKVVYSPPKRLFTFDDDFKTPSLLPPRTPMVRDINTTSFNKLPGPTSP